MKRPSFDELPLRKGDPPFSAWGLYGKDDQLGTLNLLTNEVVAAAETEIREGVRIGLDLPINYFSKPSHNRLKLTHTVIRKDPRLVHDDVIQMNTQISTQWDGFRHYGYQKLRIFYNGVTVDEVSGPSPTTKLGVHAWCKQGIVGRGVLLDYYRWSQSLGRSYELIGNHEITAEDLEACAKAQQVELKQGDILLLRAGWKIGFDALSDEAQLAFSDATPTQHVGVKTSVDTIRWLWNKGFSACAGDTPGWERWPALDLPGEVGGVETLRLHEIMLNGWGMPIGELFNLEELSEVCVKLGRYSFFFASMPLNIPGGVATTGNVVAIF